MLNQVIKIHTIEGDQTTVKVIRETAKAILVEGACSEAWFPKKGLDDRNMIAPWVRLGIEHCFLFEAPYTKAA
jgi:hypothetical protein